MEYSCLFGEVRETQDKFIFFKSSGKFKETNVVNTVNEFMNLCELTLQQNNVITIYGQYTKRSHVTHLYAENTTIYTENLNMSMLVGKFYGISLKEESGEM